MSSTNKAHFTTVLKAVCFEDSSDNNTYQLFELAHDCDVLQTRLVYDATRLARDFTNWAVHAGDNPYSLGDPPKFSELQSLKVEYSMKVQALHMLLRAVLPKENFKMWRNRLTAEFEGISENKDK